MCLPHIDGTGFDVSNRNPLAGELELRRTMWLLHALQTRNQFLGEALF
jgi:hypothetical protein